MEQSKRASLSVARSILNHKLIGKKLESYLKVRLHAACQPRCSECTQGRVLVHLVLHHNSTEIM